MPQHQAPTSLCHWQVSSLSWMDDGTNCLHYTASPRTLGLSTAPVVPFTCSFAVSIELAPSEEQRETAVIPLEVLNQMLGSVVGDREIRDQVIEVAPELAQGGIDLSAVIPKIGWQGVATVKKYGDKSYVIISGGVGNIKTLMRGRFRLDNPKVVNLSFGAGKASKGSVKVSSWSVLIVGVVDVGEAVFSDDEVLKRNLPLTLSVDLFKLSFSGRISAALRSFLLEDLAIVGEAEAPLIVGGVVISIVVGIGVDQILPTDKIVAAIDDQVEKVQRFLEHTARVAYNAMQLWDEIHKKAVAIRSLFTESEWSFMHSVLTD